MSTVAVETTQLRDRNVATIPSAVRQALRIRPGDQLAFEIDQEGNVRVRGMRTIPTDQAWFWSPEWQQKEREADDDIAKGQTEVFDSSEAFLAAFGKQ